MSFRDDPAPAEEASLCGRRVAIVGRLAGMTRLDVRQLVRERGGQVVDRVDASVTLLVVGADSWPSADGAALEEQLDEAARRATEQGQLEVITETQLWERLGLVESEPSLRLYTPAMLANLLRVPVAVVRRWHRRGLIVPVRTVRKLPYFDFPQVAAARRLAELVTAGVSPATIEKQLAALARFVPAAQRQLAQLSILVEGRELLLRRGEGLVDVAGQRRLDFDAQAEGEPSAAKTAAPAEAEPAAASPQEPRIFRLPRPAVLPPATDQTPPEDLLAAAIDLDDEGRLAEAAATYRALIGLVGPTAELCFQLAELLYRMGDLSAARERYYMAVELDEDYVEARANLGCVLAESGELELAAAAFEGALARHPDFPDAHYHLARTLEELHRRDEARSHWQSFLALSPDSPWADEARRRLEV